MQSSTQKCQFLHAFISKLTANFKNMSKITKSAPLAEAIFSSDGLGEYLKSDNQPKNEFKCKLNKAFSSYFAKFLDYLKILQSLPTTFSDAPLCKIIKYDPKIGTK